MEHLKAGQGPRRARTALVAVTAASLAAGSLLAAQSASAAIPKFPNNVVVFPDRDFVSVEGYSERAGQTAVVEVVRQGQVTGSAKGTISGTDVAFEINHPGGVCWGNGTTDKVTPDIRPGDVVQITFEDGTHDETTTADAAVTGDLARDGNTITVRGHVGPTVNQAQMEQRIINPDLVDTAVAKRDIRAVSGPLVPAAKGGYSSSLAFPTADTFLATYVFDDAASAAIAAAADLGERAMSWQEEDADGNRQGLTIAEYGELGGPGMGGCPAGPGDQAAPLAGAASVVYSADKTSMQVKWTPAVPQAGAAAVTGYSIAAIAQTATGGQQVQRGMRTGATATQTTIAGLDPAEKYTVEVRSLAGARMSEALTMAPAPVTDPTTPGDTVQPTLEVSPAPAAAGGPTTASSVSIASDGQIFFTTDGSPVVSGNLPSDTAQLYTKPIAVTAAVTLRVAAFDQAGNSRIFEGDFVPPAEQLQAPAAPTGLAATAGQGSVTLRWDAGAASVTGYQVTVYNAAGAAQVAGVQPAETTARTQTVTGLTGGTSYQFTVKAKNAAAGYGAESAKVSAAAQQVTDTVTISGARWKAGSEFRINGTGSVVGTTVTVYRATSTGTIGTAITGANGAVVAAAPPGIGDYDIRLRNGSVPATNPGRIFVKSSNGGVAGPFTVSTK